MNEAPRSTVETLEDTPDLALLPPDSDSPAYRARKAARKRELFGTEAQMPRIGRFIVLERIGAGGMGEVFAAYDDELDRKVAIKVVHADISEESSQAGSRLLREAQTLAKLSHANVVHVYEVGTIEGRVYLAMEFIRGQTLRIWLTHSRTWEAILDAFVDLGRGLAAVHEAGMVHRDVKPDNMLVGEDGRVYVADFGLARAAAALTDPSLDRIDMEAAIASVPEIAADSPSRLTASGAIVGTPAYMAPEQLRTQVVDARCDQFSFCVSLWEALAGRRPYHGRSLPDIVDAYKHGPPTPPAPTRVPPRVWRALQRGLAIDPIDRWSSMSELLDELVATRARPRRRMPILLGFGGLAFGLGAWVFAATGTGPCDGIAASLDGTWDDDARTALAEGMARSGAAYSSATAHDVTARMDEVAVSLLGERTSACEATRVQHTQSEEMLDRRMACLERVAGRMRALAGALAEADATAVLHAPDAAAALPDPQMCRPESLHDGVVPPATAELRDEVEAVRSELADASTRIELGQSRRARPVVEALVERATSTDYAPVVAEARMVEASAARDLGELDAAREHWLDAADLAESSRHDTVAADAWAALTRLSWTDLDDVDAGRRWLRRARAAATRVGLTDTRAADLLRSEGEIERLAGNVPLARTKLEQALERLGHEHATDSPQTWRTLLSLATVMEASGDPRGALSLFRRYRDRIEARLGPAHPMVASASYNVGKLLVATGEYDAARENLARSIAVWREAYGDTHPDLAYAHVALEEIELTVGDLTLAREHAEEALRIREATLSSDHPDLGLALLGVGAVALLLGDTTRAVGANEEALAIHERSFGAVHPQTAIVRANLAEALIAADEGTRALQEAARASADLDGFDGMNPVVLAFARRVLGGAYRLTGRREEAIAALREGKALLASHTGDPLERGLLHLELARALGDDPAAAVEAAEAARLLGSAGGEASRRYLAQLQREFPSTR